MSYYAGRIYLSLLLCLVSLSLFSQDTLTKTYYRNGQIQSIGKYVQQLKNGDWTSKLGWQHGVSFDVSHTIESISNGYYGDVSIYMKRNL